MSNRQDEPPFASWEITFRNPKSYHLFHEEEGITKTMIIDVLRKAREIREDPRPRLRKNIRLYHVTEHLTERIRITVIFQMFPREKRVHVLNAFLGSFHHKNLYEQFGLKGNMNGEGEEGKTRLVSF